ncbi:hypothetical protein HanRHA438_Chr16g0770751 [Helianthus annuus]|nr:hypothetical protein HanRHA438_Chr16g0770751 [Helianthus annuus]
MWTGSCRRRIGSSTVHFWILWQWNSLRLQCFLLILVFQKLHEFVDISGSQHSVVLQDLQETTPLRRQSISKLLHNFSLSCHYTIIIQFRKQMIKSACHISQGLLIHTSETFEFFLEKIMTHLTCCCISHSSVFQSIPQLLCCLEADKLMVNILAQRLSENGVCLLFQIIGFLFIFWKISKRSRI